MAGPEILEAATEGAAWTFLIGYTAAALVALWSGRWHGGGTWSALGTSSVAVAIADCCALGLMQKVILGVLFLFNDLAGNESRNCDHNQLEAKDLS